MEPREIHEGDEILVKGSAKEPYRIRMIDGLVSCSCPAWRNARGVSREQGGRVRICKHIKAAVLPSSIPVLDQTSMVKIDWDNLPPTTTNSGLYRIVCSANGRFYIGETDSFKTRWRIHRWELKRGSHHNPQLQLDYSALGDDAFSFQPYRDIANQKQRRADETQDILIYLGFDCCYNKTECSPPSALGKRQTKEHRAKNSAAHLGRKATSDTRAKMSAAKTGTKVSPEALIRIRSRDRRATAETKAKISAAGVGKVKSPETRTKMRVAMQTYWAELSEED